MPESREAQPPAHDGVSIIGTEEGGLSMKAFATGAIVSALLAVLAGVILQSYASRSADEAFSSPSARVGAEATPAARDWVRP